MVGNEQEPRATDAGDENVDAGIATDGIKAGDAEGGGPKTGVSAGENTSSSGEQTSEDAAAADPVAGISTDMRIEIDLLTYAMLREVVNDIAKRCAEVAATRTIVVASSDVAAAFGPAILLYEELDTLAGELEKLAAADQQGLESALGTNGLTTASGGISELIGGMVKIAKAVEVTDKYSARSVGIDEATLLAVLAGSLKSRGVTPVLLTAEAPYARHNVKSLNRIVSTLANLRTKPDSDAERRATLDGIAATIAPLREKGSASLLALRVVAAIQGDASPLVLTARALAAGGAYLERTHLFTRLGLVDKLSFNAGAAVLFSLYEMPDGIVIASDIAMEVSGKTKMPKTSAIFSNSTLAGTSKISVEDKSNGVVTESPEDVLKV